MIFLNSILSIFFVLVMIANKSRIYGVGLVVAVYRNENASIMNQNDRRTARTVVRIH